MVECTVTSISIITGINLVCLSMVLLPTIKITSKICSLIVTIADKDNPSSDALLSDNSSNSQETFVKGKQVHF